MPPFVERIHLAACSDSLGHLYQRYPMDIEGHGQEFYRQGLPLRGAAGVLTTTDVTQIMLSLDESRFDSVCTLALGTEHHGGLLMGNSQETIVWLAYPENSYLVNALGDFNGVL